MLFKNFTLFTNELGKHLSVIKIKITIYKNVGTIEPPHLHTFKSTCYHAAVSVTNKAISRTLQLV